MSTAPDTTRRDLGHLAGAVLLPFVSITVFLTLGDAGLPLHYFVMLGASLLGGFMFVWEAVGRRALWLALIYVPAMALLLVVYTIMWACETGKGCI